MYVTQHDPKASIGGGYEPDEIEVTPAMIEAGERALRDPRWLTSEGIQWLDTFDWYGRADLPLMLTALYRAMRASSDSEPH